MSTRDPLATRHECVVSDNCNEEHPKCEVMP